MEKLVGDFEVIDHGAEHSQYFQGCGVAFSRFEHVVTGAGSSPSEALDDALDQVASMGWDAEALECRLVPEDGYIPSEESSIPLVEEGDGDEEAPEGSPHPDWYHYVSIRWNPA